MKLYINGQSFPLTKNGNTLEQAINQYMDSQNKSLDLSFAVALNGNFISKDDYAQTKLNDGDSIDVLFPIQGG
ncbi:sulfur carrier protein ThiS [Thalassotalea psychrophila]|uniref:Sulfur carrier protein ThiS n=1 Tax=Thalassotalea psychrophila TaxID=3065647 RepID=A0ABY9TP40_9GAMM|nr:sulfur carrier protein ThiS [Colwelliaceae bacterium SQ149]